MPDIAVGAFVSTEEILADERVVDMDPTMRKLDPDSTQFTTMTQRMPSRATTREKFNWLEEQYVQNVFTLDAAYTAGATTVSVGTAESAAIKANDILRNMTTGEALLVTAVGANGDLTVVPSVGNVPASSAAGTVGDKLVFVGSAFEQGASLPDPKYSQRVLGFNYTQIFRGSWEFSKTATSIELYGGGEPGKEGARKAVEHKRELEHSGFFGARDWYTTGTGPRGVSGGLIEFIASNKQDVNGELTSDFLDLFLATVLSKGSSDKVIFTGTIGAYYISRFHRSGQGAFWKPSRESVHGVQVDGFISGVYGYQIPVVVKKEWANYPSGDAGYNGNMFIVDMTNVERRPLRERDTKLLTNRQNPGDDKYAAEYLTEMGWTVAQEKTHGLLTGIS
jgi:Family of unknown function (DUF5309)